MVRILIVDDQKIVREGIKILLEKSAEIEIIGDASDGKEGLKKTELLQPDVVLLDIDMPGISGLAVAKKIRSQFPDIKTIMLSSHEDEKYVQKATESGAKGYLLKNASSQELEWSIKLVHQGYSAIKSELLEQQFAHQTTTKSDLHLDKGLETDNKQSCDSTATLSKRDQKNLDKLELLLANKEIEKKQSRIARKKGILGKTKQPLSLFHNVSLSQTKKTISSFEFRLLVFAILFCLGFLTFIALS